MNKQINSLGANIVNLEVEESDGRENDRSGTGKGNKASSMSEMRSYIGRSDRSRKRIEYLRDHEVQTLNAFASNTY